MYGDGHLKVYGSDAFRLVLAGVWPVCQKRLGNEPPEFSTASWIFMMFPPVRLLPYCSGDRLRSTTTSHPAVWLRTELDRGERVGAGYSLFHWGPLPWATYSFLSVASLTSSLSAKWK